MAGLTLFVGSCFATIALQSFNRRHRLGSQGNTGRNTCSGNGENISEDDYISTLKELFNPYRHGTSKLPSRHISGGNTSAENSTEDIFAQRKLQFSSLFESSGLRSAGCTVIHVAGTKGKGSTVEYIAAGIIERGTGNVGVFTSPHMHTACERVKINRALISRNLLVEYGKEALSLLNQYSWTVFFDLLMAVALMHFGASPERIKYLLLETGIGGRYDSTNFCDDTAVCVITSISLDHQNILGDTVEQIAWQKAGIIKRNSHVFTPSTQQPSVLRVIRSQCQQLDATLHVVQPDSRLLQYYQVQTETAVQVENACLAVAVLQHLQILNTPQQIITTAANVVTTAATADVPTQAQLFNSFYWPCRFERFAYSGTNLIVDGAHNEDSVRRFLRSIRTASSSSGDKAADSQQPLHLRVLFGAGQDKCLLDMSRVVFEEADSVMLVQAAHFRAIPEAQLWDLVTTTQPDTVQKKLVADQLLQGNLMQSRVPEGTVGKNLQWAVANHPQDSNYVVAICGSLFVAAETREHLFRMAPKLFAADDWVRSMDPPLGL